VWPWIGNYLFPVQLHPVELEDQMYAAWDLSRIGTHRKKNVMEKNNLFIFCTHIVFCCNHFCYYFYVMIYIYFLLSFM
jgi:hypothetical protein